MATTPHGGCLHPDAKVEPDFECGVCPWCRRRFQEVQSALWEALAVGAEAMEIQKHVMRQHPLMERLRASLGARP